MMVKNLNTFLDDASYLELKMFCLEKGLQVKEVISEVIHKGITALRKEKDKDLQERIKKII